ncbi:hypothetical protein SAMN05443247_07008 [Bradyrhizobium erythrophlei]|nr:hypothetical protein SAMN05443247_07008 [Bradyrhizobium erythrophlei]
MNLAHLAGLAYRLPDNQLGGRNSDEALQHIRTLVEASAELKHDTQRKVLLRSVVVVAQKGLGVAPDGHPSRFHYFDLKGGGRRRTENCGARHRPECEWLDAGAH